MYENKTYEQIKQKILSNISNINTSEGSFINDMVSPISMEFEGAYEEFAYLLGTMFLVDADSEELEKRANEYGIFRKAGTHAVGSVKVTGARGTLIKKGTLVSTYNGLNFETTEDKIIEINEVIINIKATEVGQEYNVPVNTIIKLPISIAGVLAVVNHIPTISGVNKETDYELRERIFDKLQNPSNGGNISDFRRWSVEIDGVADAKIFPLWNGNGTVKVMPITTAKKAPDITMLSKIKTNIEYKRPLGANVTVQPPIETIVNVVARIKLDPSYTLDYVITEYNKRITQYIENSVFKRYIVEHGRCLSFLYDIEGVEEVLEFKLNNDSKDIVIGTDNIQVLGTIDINLGR